MDLIHPLIEPAALAALLDDRHVRIIDATYAVGGPGPAPYENWLRARIGNAAFFDIDAIADRHTYLPHMLPAPDDFAQAVSALGISSTDRVIVYDQGGIAMAAARVWWTFRVFGHDNVAVLNGGLPQWQAAGLPVNTAPPRPPAAPGAFTASLRPALVRSLDDVRQAIGTDDTAIVDARAAARFAGDAPEPRPGLRAGHIPGSLNVPFASLVDGATGRLKDEALLVDILAPVTRQTHVISSCGSGVTACVLALAMHTLGRPDVAVYDGSWIEWGAADAGTPVEQGN